nr:hypothetical protein [Tanacetum cinerariifolium]
VVGAIGHGLAGFVGRGTDVRQGDRVAQFEQRRFRQRLFLVNVQTRTPNSAVLQRFDQGRFDRHVETQTTTARNGGADVAHADDAQRLAINVSAEVRRFDAALPVAGLGVGVQLGDAAGTAHDQREAQVG